MGTCSISTNRYIDSTIAQMAYTGADKNSLTNANFSASFSSLTVTGSGWKAIDRASIDSISYNSSTGVITIAYTVATSSSAGDDHGSVGTITVYKIN